MSLLDKLERKFARYAVPNVTQILVFTWIATFLYCITQPSPETAYDSMTLDMEKVYAGEWWRMIVFVCLPPALSPLWMLFGTYLFWLFGSSLENQWGAFRYNVYLIIAAMMTYLAAFLLPGLPLTNMSIEVSVFLAFAYLFPDFTLLLFFILPVKVKWLALLRIALLVGTIISTPVFGLITAATVMTNYLLFFGGDMLRRMRGAQRRSARKIEARAMAGMAFHTCSVCRATDKSDPELTFKYFPTIKGTECFCENHYPSDNPAELQQQADALAGNDASSSSAGDVSDAGEADPDTGFDPRKEKGRGGSRRF
jgi:hypothetical protein